MRGWSGERNIYGPNDLEYVIGVVEDLVFLIPWEEVKSKTFDIRPEADEWKARLVHAKHISG